MPTHLKLASLVAAVAMLGGGVGLAVNALSASSAVQSPTSFYFCASAAGVPEGITYSKLGSPPTNCRAGFTDIWSSSGWTKQGASTTTTSTSTTTLPPTTTTTAPAPVVNIDRPFSAASPWNTPTPAGTQWFDTPRLHTDASGAQRHWWANTGTGIYYAVPSDPLWTFNMPAFVALAWNRNRPATSFQMRAPANLAPTGDADSDIVVVEPNGDYVEVWQAAVDSVNRIVTSNPGPGWATGNAITGTGVGSLVADGGNNAGVRASNFSFQAGRISLNEITGPTPIDHALVVILTNDMLMGGNTYVAPATAGDGQGAGLIKAGSRIGVSAGVAMPAGLSPLGVKVFTALQRYGAFVGDYAGGNLPIFQTDLISAPDGNPACPLYCYWDYGGSSDMEKIGPLLRVADYQP